MIAAALLAIAAGQSPVVPSLPSLQSPPPVAEWPALPLFPLSVTVDDGGSFVRREVEAGRCDPGPPVAADVRIEAPVAILVGPTGLVRQIVPQAIGCATIEQYTVGHLLSLTRNGAGRIAALSPGWYRLTMGYRW